VSEYRRNEAHVEQGLDRLLERFRGKPRIAALLRILLERAQRVDNVLWDLYTGMWLDNAIGEQLDALGGLVGEARQGRADSSYRTYIRARARINRANGQIVDTLDVLHLISLPSVQIAYREELPASYAVEVRDSGVSAATLFRLSDEVRGAGIGLTVVSTADSAHALIWDDNAPAHVWDAGQWGSSFSSM